MVNSIIHSKPLLIIFLALFILRTESTEACTAFCIKKDNQIVLAKNLDWLIMVIPFDVLNRQVVF